MKITSHLIQNKNTLMWKVNKGGLFNSCQTRNVTREINQDHRLVVSSLTLFLCFVLNVRVTLSLHNQHQSEISPCLFFYKSNVFFLCLFIHLINFFIVFCSLIKILSYDLLYPLSFFFRRAEPTFLYCQIQYYLIMPFIMNFHIQDFEI